MYKSILPSPNPRHWAEIGLMGFLSTANAPAMWGSFSYIYAPPFGDILAIVYKINLNTLPSKWIFQQTEQSLLSSGTLSRTP